MTDGATGTSSGSGHQVSSAEPGWTPLHEPTYRQLQEPGILEVAAHRIHGDVLNNGTIYPIPSGSIYVQSGWSWWVKVDRTMSWMHRYSPVAAASAFDPDEGRVIKGDSKEEHTIPGRWERVFMSLQGKAALHQFIDKMDATNSERAAYFANVSAVAAAVEYGDLPAAIRSALAAGLPNLQRDRLVGLLENYMIYWPDFQRRGSTSADRTIAHHRPSVGSSLTISGSGTNSGTSLTISGSGTTSGTSLTISASVTAGGATG